MRERGGAILPGIGEGSHHQHKEKKTPPVIALVLLFISFIYFFGSGKVKHLLEHQDYNFIGLDLEIESPIMVASIVISLLVIAVLVDSYTGKYYVLLIGAMLYLSVPFFQLMARWVYSSVRLHRLFTELAFYLNSSFNILSGVRYAWYVDQMDMVKGGHAQENYLFLLAFSHVFGHFVESAASVLFHIFHVATKTSYIVATVVLSIHLILFLGVRRRVVHKAVYRHIVFQTIACMFCAVKNYSKRDRSEEKEDHIFDYALGDYSYNIVETSKRLLRLLPLFFPLMWYGLTKGFLNSVWQHQLEVIGALDQKTFFFSAPDLCERLMVVCLLPTMHFYVIPCINKKFNFLVTDLQCLCNSYLMLSLSIIATLILQYVLDKNRTLFPAAGYGQIRLYNAIPERTNVLLNWFGNFSLPPLEMFSGLTVFTRGKTESEIVVRNNKTGLYLSSTVFVLEKQSLSYIITEDGLEQINVVDPLGTPSLDNMLKARIFLISSLKKDDAENRVVIEMKSQKVTKTLQHPGGNSLVFFGLNPSSYEMKIINKNSKDVINLEIAPRTIYTILIYDSKSPKLKTFKLVEQPYKISIYYMIPQWLFHALALACGEVALTRFAYTQFPEHLRTVICTFILLGYEISRDFLTFKLYHRWFRSDSFMTLLVLTIHFIFLFFFMYLSLHYIYVFNLKRRVTVGDFFLLRGMAQT